MEKNETNRRNACKKTNKDENWNANLWNEWISFCPFQYIL